MSDIRFVIEGKPQGKARPRFAKIGGYVRTYTPKQTASREQEIALAYRAAGGGLFHGAVRVDIEAQFTPPKSWSKKRRESTLFTNACCKPDADNISKLVLDALNGVAWADDKSVVMLVVQKRYSTTAQTVVWVAQA